MTIQLITLACRAIHSSVTTTAGTITSSSA